MQTIISFCCMLWLAGMIGCQSSEQKSFTLQEGERSANHREEKNTLASFSSDSSDSVQVRLLLWADSTYLLEVAPRKASPAHDLRGKLAIAKDHYQLFFPDTVAQLNELITPVHHDASVAVYPDHSVVLDKALTQFYVRGVLVTSDTSARKR